jgi:hypothetical protein
MAYEGRSMLHAPWQQLCGTLTTLLTLPPSAITRLQQTEKQPPVPAAASHRNPRPQSCRHNMPLPSRGAGDRRRTVMVLFIGGVTYAEVSALRFLSQKGLVNCDFVVATTKMVTGSSLLAPLIARSQQAGGAGE